MEAVEETLEEAEFFVMQGCVDDARSILLDQWARTPGHRLLREKLEELGVNPETARGSRAPDSAYEVAGNELEPEDQSFDIAASLDALDDAAAASVSGVAPFPEASQEVDVEQVFEKFKAGVREQVSESDSATHYDLGVAYKEMGLLRDAISEFFLAARDARRACTCYSMIGMLELELDKVDAAIEAYLNGLDATQKTDDQEISLLYDLGNAYEVRGDVGDALDCFERVLSRDAEFRDIQDRVDALRGSAEVRAPKPRYQEDDEFDKAFEDMFKE
jgi:tetratricopeptide (TPR) repeat protein